MGSPCFEVHTLTLPTPERQSPIPNIRPYCRPWVLEDKTEGRFGFSQGLGLVRSVSRRARVGEAVGSAVGVVGREARRCLQRLGAVFCEAG